MSASKLAPTTWLTVEQFAELVQLTPVMVRKHIRASRIPATYVRNVGTQHHRRYRINPRAINPYRL